MSAKSFIYLIQSAADMPYADIPAGIWHRLPDTKLLDAAPPSTAGSRFYGNAGPRGVISAWSGGALDTKRNRMLVWGGGHRAYAGNELYAFDIAARRWERLTEPSPIGGYNTRRDKGVLADGAPVARHTYNNLVYLPPPVDGLWAQGGSNWHNGEGDRRTWLYSFGAGKWQRLASAPQSYFDNLAALDARRQRIIHYPNKNLYAYDIGKDSWSRVAAGPRMWTDRSVAVDTRRQRYMVLGRKALFAFDLARPQSRQRIKTRGARAIESRRAPGFAYDAAHDRLVAWAGGGRVYSYDIDARTWYRHDPADPQADKPGKAQQRGTYGRFRYVPAFDLFVLVNAADDDVFVYRLDPATGRADNGPRAAGDKGPKGKVTVSPGGRVFGSIAEAARAAPDGATVEIHAGTYRRDVAVWKQNDLLIRGVGGRPVLNADGRAAQSKGIFVIKGDRVRVENLEFTGAAVNDRNGAGIRHEGIGLTVVNCYFHHNQNGILGGSHPRNDILIEDSEFAFNGFGDGRSHNIYIGRARSLTVRNVRSHHARIGHQLKSRAASNLIESSRFYDGEDGQSSYAIDISNGGRAVLRNNLVQQGPATQNRNLISYGAEGLKYPDNVFILEGNTLVDESRAKGRFIQSRGGVTPEERDNTRRRGSNQN